jgi:hypothetical protein
VQEPQSSIPPQPSATVPHPTPRAEQVFGAQPHTLGWPAPPHVDGAAQPPPQVIMPPHPSLIVPQFAPWMAQVVVVQPQALATPPPPQV